MLLCLLVLTLACSTLFAADLKVAPPPAHVTYIAMDRVPPANVTIFTNLSTDPTNLYNVAAGGYYVCGVTCGVLLEDQWIGIPFTNKVADHATMLQAAIGYDSGTKRVVLAVYSDSPGVGPGTLLAMGSATMVPNTGTCCQLVTVHLAGTGLALAANTKYWLVAQSDDTHAPDFEGVWQASYSSDIGGNVANGGWFTFSGLVPAGAVKGTQP
jgi:hypothetical protein